LEEVLATYVGVKHCITCASGTDSLEIALRALGIGPGDEVITVPFTWISTAEVIGLVGAKPVFVDIEPATFNINVDLIGAAVTPRTKAIIPVSLFGQMPDYSRINAIAAKYGIAVIEDGAQSFGATQRTAPSTIHRMERGSSDPHSVSSLQPRANVNVRTPSLSDPMVEERGEEITRRSCGVTLIGSTSFFPAKPLGCYGDGGALFTNDDALAEKMRAIRTHGALKRHNHPFLGMNGRFDTLQAAVLLAKLPHFDWEVQERTRIGARYTALLSSVLCPPSVTPGNTHVYAQYTIRVPNRDAVAAKLKEKRIPTAVYYPKCLHEQPVFAGNGSKWGDFPESEKASREVLSLPMHPFQTEADQDRVVEAVRETVSAKG
jgi:UDP-2-acetamido-2-deoxy-ribo-hexuluronate aminotransferase